MAAKGRWYLIVGLDLLKIGGFLFGILLFGILFEVKEARLV